MKAEAFFPRAINATPVNFEYLVENVRENNYAREINLYREINIVINFTG